MSIRMHVERTADPEVIEFVVRDLPAYEGALAAGRFTSCDLEGLPLGLAALLAGGNLDEVVVAGERVACRRAAQGQPWSTLAPRCHEALTSALHNVDVAALAAAAVREGVGALAASHGGSITVSDANAEQVTVRLSGACNGCPAAAHTLRNGLRQDLNRIGLDGAQIHVE